MNPSQTPSVDTQPTELEALRDRVFPKAQRPLTGPLRAIVTVASVGLTVFTLYMGFHITLGPIVTRAAHLMVVIPLAFLLYPARKRLPHGGPSPVDYLEHITLGPIVTRAAHLMVVIPLAFLLYPARKRLPHGVWLPLLAPLSLGPS